MKPILNKQHILFILFGLIISGLNSCKKNEDGRGMPSISRVRTVSKQESIAVTHQVTVDSSYTSTDFKPALFDSIVTAGNLNGLYAIIGQNLVTANSVTVNGVAATMNPALNTDNAVIFTIAAGTPYANQENKLVVTTKYGKASFDFSVAQPSPVITDASQLAGNTGDVITLTGSALDNATAVKFGTVAGLIQANTSTQITVKVPANAFGPISVTTSGGTATGPAVSYDGKVAAIVVPFGFSNILYDDAINAGGYDFNFNGVVQNTQNTAIVKRGSSAIMIQYTGNYAGYAVGAGTPISLTGKTYIKFSIYGAPGTEGRVIKVGVNDFETHIINVLVHEKKWSTYAIPVSLLQSLAPGTLSVVNWVGFQDLSGTPPTTIYLDDIGIF